MNPYYPINTTTSAAPGRTNTEMALSPKNQKLTPGLAITMIGEVTLETVLTVLAHPEVRVAGKKCPILPPRVFSSRTTYRFLCDCWRKIEWF
jgi:hypothetical protein